MKLRLNAAKRVGAFKRGIEAGLSPEQARLASDQLYPPSQEDLEFEAALRSGSAKPIPVASAIALLYPVAATAYAFGTASGLVGALGYGVTSLGYLLFFAAVISGTFLVFGLKKRSHVLVAGAIVFTIGVALSNVRV